MSAINLRGFPPNVCHAHCTLFLLCVGGCVNADEDFVGQEPFAINNGVSAIDRISFTI